MPIVFLKSYGFLKFLESAFLLGEGTATASRLLASDEQKGRHRTQCLRAIRSLINTISPVFLLTILLSGLFLPSPAVAARITLAWNASSGPVEGYRIYYGSTTQHYMTILPAPPSLITSTTYTTPDLPAGTYYFAVKAFGKSNNQSGFSNEVAATISAQATTQGTNSPAPSSSGSTTTTSPPVTTAPPKTDTSTEGSTSHQASLPSRLPLTNIYTRGWVGTGDNAMIAGFGITGNSPKQVLIRATGPSLASARTSNLLYDPTLTLYRGQSVLAHNDNWQDHQAASITATGKAPRSLQEPALLITLNPGFYTAIVRGVSDTTGNAVIEMYETGQTASTLTNLSARGRVERDNAMLVSFSIGGTGEKWVLIRAYGPTLSAAGIPNALVDPTLTLYSGQATLASNNNWRDSQAAEIAATGRAPTDPRESAIVVRLKPGFYTAIVRGVNNTVGNTLIDIQDLTE